MSSFTEEYLKLRKKRLEEQASRGATESKKQSNGSRPVMLNTLTPQANSDIAPVRQTEQEQQMASNDDSGFFQRVGAFDDGWQFGDVTKTILGSVSDLGVNVLKGAGRLVEGVTDLVGHGVAGVADLMGQDDWADNFKDDVNKSWVDELAAPADEFLDEYSVFGNTGDAVGEGLGQVASIILTGGALGAAGVGAAGVSAATTGLVGASSMGSGLSEAYLGGATDEEALRYGLMKGTIDAGTELLFGGLGKTVKALGLSKGLSSLDDIFAKKLSSKISSQFFSNAVEWGVKSSAEGLEEVLAGIGTAVAKDLTYMSEEDLGTLLKDENLLDQFIVGAVTSGISQSGLVPGTKKGSLVETTKQGRDFVTGLTANEQSVADKVYQDRLTEAEEGGKKLTNKEKNKLYDEVMNDLKKGYIDTDTIEEVLGGAEYESYKQTVAEQDALQKEIDEIRQMKKSDLTVEQDERYNEIKQKLADMKGNKVSEQTKAKLSEAVQSRLMREVKGEMQVADNYLAESYNEKARGQQRFEADLSQYDKKQQDHVKRALESGVLNNRNSAHDIVGLTAKIEADKGVRINYVNNKMLKDMGIEFDGADANGFIKDGEIYINVESPKYLQFIVGHEITHTMEQHKELYAEMQKALFDVAKSKGEYDSRLKSVTKTYAENDPTADPTKELTADLVGDYLFTDEDFVRRLSTEHRNVFQKVWDEIKYLYKVATGSKEAKELQRIGRQLCPHRKQAEAQHCHQ